MQIYGEGGNSQTYADNRCFYPETGGSVYDSSSYMRKEITNITPKTIYDNRAFLDLGSDLMYTQGDTYGGLFETKWDLNSIYDEGGDTFTSIKNHAYANKYSSSYLTFNFKQLTTKTSWFGKTEAIKHRVHTRFNINGTFSGPNPLWLRIESEELNEGGGDKQNTTVRQIFINVNADNTGQNYRPLVIFYDGPDRAQLDGDVDTGKNQTVKEKYPNLKVRDPLPVILNLNADFKGILFAPNSPVVIIGNGHKMLGFVVAKSFVKLGTSGNKISKSGYDPEIYCDSYGNISFEALSSSVIRRPYNKVFKNAYVGSYVEEYNEETLNAVKDTYKEANFVNYEFVYKADAAFNLSTDSRYASFGIDGLKRNIYTYMNSSQASANNNTDPGVGNSVDMFFTTVRSRWIK